MISTKLQITSLRCVSNPLIFISEYYPNIHQRDMLFIDILPSLTTHRTKSPLPILVQKPFSKKSSEAMRYDDNNIIIILFYSHFTCTPIAKFKYSKYISVFCWKKLENYCQPIKMVDWFSHGSLLWDYLCQILSYVKNSYLLKLI
jgi:hypothetical protein